MLANQTKKPKDSSSPKIRKRTGLTEENYYSREMDKKYCSASQFLDIIGRPAIPGCEARAMAKLKGDYAEETTKAMIIGSILDTLWELDDLPLEEKVSIIADKFPECVSTRGNTQGELKAEYKQAIKLYQRTLKDELFCKFMSGKKQVIMTGKIEGVPFKIKMDSYIPSQFCIQLIGLFQGISNCDMFLELKRRRRIDKIIGAFCIFVFIQT